MRVLTVSDSDSYLKWAAALLEEVPADWRVRHAVLTNVLEPSEAQTAAVRTGWPLERRTAAGIAALVHRERPDVVVLACTGPALEAVQEVLAAARLLGAGRPVLATGLPGISWPANDLAVEHRRHCDVMVLHSRREVAAYAAVVERLGAGPRPVLATLPFLRDVRPSRGGRQVVFAAQSLVPRLRGERIRILRALAAVPEGLEPVVKVRAFAGERQAHNEDHPYAELWEALAPHAQDIAFRAGAMSDALEGAAGFVTVSSTAAIEAVAAGVPSLVLGDFGVDAAMINEVFIGSGLIGSLGDLTAGRFRTPDPAWLSDNYFHDAGADDWRQAFEELAAGPRTPIDFRPHGGALTRVRRLARLAPRRPVVSAQEIAQRVRPSRW